MIQRFYASINMLCDKGMRVFTTADIVFDTYLTTGFLLEYPLNYKSEILSFTDMYTKNNEPRSRSRLAEHVTCLLAA